MNRLINCLTRFHRLDAYQRDEEQFKRPDEQRRNRHKSNEADPWYCSDRRAGGTADIVWLATQTVTLPDGST